MVPAKAGKRRRDDLIPFSLVLLGGHFLLSDQAFRSSL
jgi:hypothetical protein